MHRLQATLVLLAAVLAGAAPARAYDTADLRATLTREMRHATVASGADVRDLDTGRDLFALRAGVPRVPASVEKLYTTSTALLRLGPATTLDTKAVSNGTVDAAGVLHGDLVLVGAGDPFFGAQSAAGLARAVRAAGVTSIDGAVVGDESEFDTRRSGCCSGYDSDLGGVLSALAFDGGISAGRPQLRAARFAAVRFAALLRTAGVRSSRPSRAAAAPPGAVAIAVAPSMDVSDLIRDVNVPSNNFAAEMLLKTLGARYGAGGTTLGGAAVVRSTLAQIGLKPQILDGSGLSHSDRTSPRDVVGLLARMNLPDIGGAFRSSLAISGRTGTVKARMRGTAAAGHCRVKTGTLRTVSGLSGYCSTRGGRDIAFSLMFNRANTVVEKAREDRITAAIARLDAAPGVAPPAAGTAPAPGQGGGAVAP